MEKAKISARQLFVLMGLFGITSSLLLPLATNLQQDAWIAILLSTIGGIFLFLINNKLFQYYPQMPLTGYTQKILGKTVGWIVGFLYTLYFLHFAARTLRAFGELLAIFAYPETPLIAIDFLMILAIVYTVRKGIEVLSRTGEIFFITMCMLFILGFLLLVINESMHIRSLKPFMQHGAISILKTSATNTLFSSFAGSMVIFSMIFPYVNHPKKVKKTGIVAIGLSGIIVSIITFINISVLGTALMSRTQYPLLRTIQTINIANFIERLDVFYMVILIIGSFITTSLFFYAAVSGTASLFNIEEPSQLCYPLGMVVLLMSHIVASDFQEYLVEGGKYLSYTIHLPFQLGIPILLLIIAFVKNRKNKGNSPGEHSKSKTEV